MFTVRCYDSAVYAVVMCLSVCPSVRLSQVHVLSKLLIMGSRKQCHSLVRGHQFFSVKDLDEIPMG